MYTHCEEGKEGSRFTRESLATEYRFGGEIMERKRARFHGSDQVETGGQWGCRVIRLNLEPGSLYLSETSSKGRIIIGGTPRETLSSNFAGEGRNSATLTRLARVLRCPAKCCSITRRIPGWNPISEGRSGSRGDFEENSCWFRETEAARRLIQLFFREIFAPFKIRDSIKGVSLLVIKFKVSRFFFLFSTWNFVFLVRSFFVGEGKKIFHVALKL